MSERIGHYLRAFHDAWTEYGGEIAGTFRTSAEYAIRSGLARWREPLED